MQLANTNGQFEIVDAKMKSLHANHKIYFVCITLQEEFVDRVYALNVNCNLFSKVSRQPITRAFFKITIKTMTK